MSEFMECDECQSKTGSPVLCGGCLVNRILIFKLTAENKDLKQRNEALNECDERAAEYRDLAAKAIEALSGYSFRDDFQKEFDELQKEFEEIKNA